VRDPPAQNRVGQDPHAVELDQDGRVPDPRDYQPSAFAFSRSYSSWEIVPLSSRLLACAI